MQVWARTHCVVKKPIVLIVTVIIRLIIIVGVHPERTQAGYRVKLLSWHSALVMLPPVKTTEKDVFLFASVLLTSQICIPLTDYDNFLYVSFLPFFNGLRKCHSLKLDEEHGALIWHPRDLGNCKQPMQSKCKYVYVLNFNTLTQFSQLPYGYVPEWSATRYASCSRWYAGFVWPLGGRYDLLVFYEWRPAAWMQTDCFWNKCHRSTAKGNVNIFVKSIYKIWIPGYFLHQSNLYPN